MPEKKAAKDSSRVKTTAKPVCFVVMGFGKKTDYSTGRVLDLNKSYENLIKPAVEAAGVTCIRADEIQHAGVIDVPMYEKLLTADVVVADLSTLNPNALYELGVRHALRPFTTIVIAESKMTYPFDINHTVIRTYEHLGEDIGVSAAKQFGGALTKAIKAILAKRESDSPVYTYLKNLKPPMLEEQAKVVAAQASAAGLPQGPKTLADADADGVTVASLVAEAAGFKKADQWAQACARLATAHELRPHDPYMIQQLALATYKSEKPTPAKALVAAKKILEKVGPETTSDPETLGLWGAVHKRLWDLHARRADLDEAIAAYEKGFYVKNDYYNGINFAYLLNLRATQSSPPEAIADWVDAQRVRRRVIDICSTALEKPKRLRPDERYWLEASIAEAWFGLEEPTKHKKALAQALKSAPEAWMTTTTLAQLKKLEPLLKQSPLRFVRAN